MRRQLQMRASGLLGTAVCALALMLAGGGSAAADPGGDPENTPIHQPRDHQPPDESKQDTTVPQPPSNADLSDHGAKGHGGAAGKPCAGCVGKADDKNPPGQVPDGSDRNAGHECDRNRGVGQTNPAHSGCRLTLPPPSLPDGGEVSPPAVQVQPPPPPNPVSVSRSPTVQTTSDTLADTGPTLMVPLIAIGIAACAGGTILLSVTRRRARNDCATDHP
jgi:hypothetical protein